MTNNLKTADELMEELLIRLSDPRCGLRDSSDTNKNRQAIIGLFDEAIAFGNNPLVGWVDEAVEIYGEGEPSPLK